MSSRRAAVSTVVTVLIIVACLAFGTVGGAYILSSWPASNNSNSILPSSLSSTAISTPGMACANVASYDESIPSTYQSMYVTLDQVLNDYSQTLDSKALVATHPVIYATELLPADSNIGPKLLSPQALRSVVNFLGGIQNLGIQGVTIDISYPILTPTFPNYDQYLSFYENVVEQVRQRGMKIDIESETPLLVGYPGLSVGVDSYANLSYSTYVTEDRAMIQTIINDLHPDYLNIGTETDTLQMLLHYPEISTPQGWGSYISSILTGLNKGTTKINVGIGSWDPISYLYATVNNSEVDAIDVHVYPVYGNYLTVLTQIGELSRQYNKPIVIDEMWLHKSVMNEGAGFVTDAKISARNLYAFWIPLDEKFLEVMSKYAQVYDVAFISPFEGTFFFAYLNYSSSTANVPYYEARQVAGQAAGRNLANDVVSPLGCYYQDLIREQTALNPSTLSLYTLLPTYASRDDAKAA
ncbi:MAG TPA: hypothetical protein VEG61_03145 [Candidatus Dormibacteraeota bacterium]|nr:hypothetical protein [Candidatus Dormibacteraeota bacterium]